MGTVTNNLQNIQPITFNDSLIVNDSANFISNWLSNANATTDSLWFVWSILMLWIFIIYMLMRKDRTFLRDFPRALLVSSGWCLIVSTGAVLFTITNNIYPVIWFTSMTFIAGLIVYNKAEKGR